MKSYSLIIIFFCGIISSYLYINSFIIDFDSQQLFTRAVALAKYNTLIPFGSQASKAGFVPGPLMSIITGLSLKVKLHSQTISFALLVSHIFSFFLVLAVVKKRFSLSKILLFMLIFWLSPWRASEVFPWNPGFLFFFSALNFYLLFNKLHNKKLISFLIPIILGFSLQFHKSILVFALSYGYLFLKKQLKLNWLFLFLGLVVVATSFYPYITFDNYAQNFSENTSDSSYYFRNLVHVGPVIKGFLYWFRYSSFYFSVDLFKSLDPQLGNFDIVFHSIKWLVGIGTIVFSLISQFKLFKRRNVIDNTEKEIIYSILLSMIFVSCLSPVSFNYWHLYLIYPFTIFTLVKSISFNIQRKHLVLIGLYLCFYNFMGAKKSFKHDYRRDNNSEFLNNITNQKYKNEMCELIKCK